MSAEDTVNSLLKSQGITLNPTDIVNPSLTAKLYNGMKINITRVETKQITQVFSLDYETIIKKDPNLANTETKIIQDGVKGEKKVIYNITYENGKEVSKKIVSEIITKKPINKIVLQGTFPVMPISRNGNKLSYSKVFTARATAYYAIYGVGNTYTASGRKAIRNPNGYSTVAVDPNVIPLGTKLFIENYGFAIAADTGTSIKGNKIDVFFNTKQEACNWAVKYVKVYILK